MSSLEPSAIDTTNALEPVANEIDVLRADTGVLPFSLDDYESPDVPPRKPRVMTPLTWSLALVLTLGAGFFGGIWVQKRNAPAATPPSAFGNRNRVGGTGQSTGQGTNAQNSGGQTGAGNQTAAGGNTSGTIVLVDAEHNAIYLTDSQGNNIKVTVSAGTIMKVSKGTTTIGDYATGASIVVAGTVDAEGTITATSVTEGVARGNRAAG